MRLFYWPCFMQYSLFGSILTIGAMIGAIISGRIADYAGRRTVSLSNFVYFEMKISFLIISIFDYGAFWKAGYGVL